jgi:hypothetical protein
MNIDTFGIPEYFCNHIGAIEDAGHGMVRIIRGIKRDGHFQPVFSLVVPASQIAIDAAAISEYVLTYKHSVAEPNVQPSSNLH